MMNALILILSALVLGASPARAGLDEDAARLRSTQELLASYGAEQARLVADPSFTDASLEALTAHPDWRVRQEAAVLLGWRRTPDLYRQLTVLAPRLDAAGNPRFGSDLLEAEGAGALLLDRFLHRGELPSVRAALVGAIVTAGGDTEQALLAVFPGETPEIQRAIVAAWKRASAEVALPGLTAAMGSPEADVRAEAARVAGWRRDGDTLVAPLVDLLDDSSFDVRVNAARSLGWLESEAAWAPLVKRLSDPNAEVRLRAVRALQRINADRAAVEPAVIRLIQDKDSGVSRAAEQVTQRRGLER